MQKFTRLFDLKALLVIFLTVLICIDKRIYKIAQKYTVRCYSDGDGNGGGLGGAAKIL